MRSRCLNIGKKIKYDIIKIKNKKTSPFGVLIFVREILKSLWFGLKKVIGVARVRTGDLQCVRLT